MSGTSHQRLPITSILTQNTNIQPQGLRPWGQGPSGPARRARPNPNPTSRTSHQRLPTTSILTQNTNIHPQGLRPWGQGPSGPALGAGPNPNPMSRTSHQRLPTTSILTQKTSIQPQGPSGPAWGPNILASCKTLGIPRHSTLGCPANLVARRLRSDSNKISTSF